MRLVLGLYQVRAIKNDDNLFGDDKSEHINDVALSHIDTHAVEGYEWPANIVECLASSL